MGTRSATISGRRGRVDGDATLGFLNLPVPFPAVARIATGTGDDGTTGLFGGGRVPKTHPRIAAYGAVDELNGHLGVVAALLRDEVGQAAQEVADEVERLQHMMFVLGADLAAPPGEEAKGGPSEGRRVTADHVDEITARIEELEDEVPVLDHFILPGGGAAGARLHLARTVCRRAERLAWAVDDASDHARVYLNRLSDLLFLLARKANLAAGEPETAVRYE